MTNNPWKKQKFLSTGENLVGRRRLTPWVTDVVHATQIRGGGRCSRAVAMRRFSCYEWWSGGVLPWRSSDSGCRASRLVMPVGTLWSRDEPQIWTSLKSKRRVLCSGWASVVARRGALGRSRSQAVVSRVRSRSSGTDSCSSIGECFWLWVWAIDLGLSVRGVAVWSGLSVGEIPLFSFVLFFLSFSLVFF